MTPERLSKLIDEADASAASFERRKMRTAQATAADMATALRELQRLRSEIALRDRCIAWCLENGASRSQDGQIMDNGSSYGGTDSELEVPAEFAAILSGKADSEVAK